MIEIEKHKVIVEIETGDIDDTIALIYALMCPHFDILAVLVCPGTRTQLGLIEKIYEYIELPENKRPMLGCYKHGKESKVEKLYLRAYGEYKEYEGEIKLGKDIIIEQCKKYKNEIIYITLGPPKILYLALLENDYIQIKMWLAQGGFAGVGVVDDNKILHKFKGMEECATWNLGGAVTEAELLLNHSRIGSRFFVSKNVCHGIVYNNDIHSQLKLLSKEKSFAYYFYNIMDKAYFTYSSHKKIVKTNDDRKRISQINKKIHDILPIMTLFNKDVCTFKEVSLKYNRKNGKWGAQLADSTNTFISVDYDNTAYFRLLLNYKINCYL